jgi:hypothetical protein
MCRDYRVGKVYKVRDGLCKVEFNPLGGEPRDAIW